MTQPFSPTQKPARVTISLRTIHPHGAATSTGPHLRTLLIPRDGSVLIGRASTSCSKGRLPAIDNALFECAVMSRSHATISAPHGPHGPIILTDTGSMHGVFVNGRKILKTEIFPSDEIRFGSQVARAEGDAFNFSEYPLLTPLPAVHHGVDLKVTNITRQGATLTDIPDSTKTVFNPSYQVPDYDTDSSKDNNPENALANSCHTKPPNTGFINLDSVSSPDFAKEPLHFNDDIADDDIESDYEVHDYPESPDELDDGDEDLDPSDSEDNESLDLSEDWDGYPLEVEDDQDDADESFDTEPFSKTENILIELSGPPMTDAPQDEAKPKPATCDEKMSIPWLVMPSIAEALVKETLKDMTTSSSTLPASTTPESLPSILTATQIEEAPGTACESTLAWAAPSQDEDKEIDAIDSPISTHHAVAKEKQPSVTDSSSKIDPPTGLKRKRDVEDEGEEDSITDLPALKETSSKSKPKFSSLSSVAVRDLMNVKKTKEATRPTKRAKRSNAKIALGALAGAIGGVATVVGVLMTPQCEQLLINWPIQ